MEIAIKLRMPEPGVNKKEPEKTIEDEVRESIALCESDKNSIIEWRALRNMYKSLCTCKQTPQVKNLRKLIKPVLSKYGFHVE